MKKLLEENEHLTQIVKDAGPPGQFHQYCVKLSKLRFCKVHKTKCKTYSPETPTRFHISSLKPSSTKPYFNGNGFNKKKI